MTNAHTVAQKKAPDIMHDARRFASRGDGSAVSGRGNSRKSRILNRAPKNRAL
jgi:hypothetical protein